MKNQYKVLMVVLSPLLLVLLLTPVTVEAANVELVQSSSENCHINLDGKIEDDDAQKIVDLMEDNKCLGEITSLTVNSGGGSQKGGQYIQEAIEFYKLDTKVDPLGTAVSAGFTILMSGEKITISHSSLVGHHSPWIPEGVYNSHFFKRQMAGLPTVPPFGHMLEGQKMIVEAIAGDIEIIPAWLIVKYIVEIEGSVYWLTPLDKLKLHKEGFITLIK